MTTFIALSKTPLAAGKRLGSSSFDAGQIALQTNKFDTRIYSYANARLGAHVARGPDWRCFVATSLRAHPAAVSVGWAHTLHN